METVHILAANLNRLVEWAKVHKKELASNKKLGDKVGLSDNTIARARRGDGGALTIVSVSKIAKQFGLTAFQLLTPGLDPSNPPEIVSEASEKRLLHAFRDNRPAPPQTPAHH